MQTGCREQNTIILARIKLTQACINITANGQYLNTGIQSTNLRHTTQTTCTHTHISIQLHTWLVRHEYIAYIFTGTYDNKAQVCRLHGGEIFQAMYRYIDALFMKSTFNLCHKYTIATNL